MQESGFACDAALARRRTVSTPGIEVPLYPRLRHSPAILPLPRPTCTLHFQAPVVLKLPGHPSPHTIHHSHGSSRLQLLPSPSPFHRSPFHAHTPSPWQHTCGASYGCQKPSMNDFSKYGTCNLSQSAWRHLLHPCRLAAARLAILSSKPRSPETTFSRTHVLDCPGLAFS